MRYLLFYKKWKKTANINNIDNNFIDFNLLGILTLAFSQIMKLEKMLTENKANSVKVKSLNEIFFCIYFMVLLLYDSIILC